MTQAPTFRCKASTFHMTSAEVCFHIPRIMHAGRAVQHALIKPLGCNVNMASLVSLCMTIYSHKRTPNLHILKPMFRVRSLNTILFHLQLAGTTCCAMETKNIPLHAYLNSDYYCSHKETKK